MRKRDCARLAAALLGAAALTGVGGMAWADQEQWGEDEEVVLTAEIEPLSGEGLLAMSVKTNAATLTESGSTALVRQFTGTLPEVKVTDTRDQDQIADDVVWYVLGSASDFEGDSGQPDILAQNLGWGPRLIDGGASGAVAPGPRVDTALDSGPNNVGLVDQEFLFETTDPSKDVVSEGEWTAEADLFLKTAPTVAPGTYTSTLTLSLFEE
ncbi:MAG: hypothetical protein LBK95_18785 [Bifidobacteriaceae bacterium]|jgi:hypothetical protein|nr:hypothetical protein [Bifidobacteriaceae bacterium]